MAKQVRLFYYVGKDDSKHRVRLFSHVIERDKLKPGDHVYVYRASGTYQHHGIYIGKRDMEIVHYTGIATKSKSTAQIRVATLDEFLYDGELHLVSYGNDWLTESVKIAGTSHTMVSKPVSEVIATAERYAQDPNSWGEYNLITNNCEQFAICCKTGDKLTFVGQVRGCLKNLFLKFVTPFISLLDSNTKLDM